MMIFGDFGSTLGLLFIFIMMLKGNIELWQIYLGIAILFRAISHAEYIHAGDHYKALKHLSGGFVANSMAAFRKFPKGELIL
ncbi:hypothetical protein EO93_08815 [Methanosarcina sp. 1.H.A.2.2]|nr:hypothetical protein EO93_08815 [Methanosarcina sp. 1.H.A.2.2]